MKKKTDKNKVDFNIDLSDLDDLDSDLSFDSIDDLDGGREPSKLKISKELAKEASKGFLDSLVKKTAAKTLPREYSDNYYTALEYNDLIKETYETNKNKINKSLYRLGKEVKKILPFQSKIINNFLEKYESDFEAFKTQSEEQLREASIQSNISSIFDKQLEIQKAFEAKRSSEAEVDRKEKLTISKLNLDVLSSIDANISNQTAFTLQIGKEYYRKSLELQYKSYFIQADMLKTMRDYYKGFSLQLDAVVKNTGLPDFVKLRNTERLEDIVRTRVVEDSYKKLFSNSEYINNVKKRFSNLIGEKISNITDNIDNATDILSSINDAGELAGKSGILGNIIAGFTGSILGEKLANKISPKIKDKIKDNKYINTGANYLTMLANSPSTLFAHLKNKTAKKTEEYEDTSSPFRYLANKFFSISNEILGVTDPNIKNPTVTGQSILTHNKPAIFDNKVHRSISEVIPMYLSKILNETSNLRWMYRQVNYMSLKNYKDTQELVYDYENRKLTTIDSFRNSIERSLLGNSKRSRKSDYVSKYLSNVAIKEIKKEGKNKGDLKILNNKELQTAFSGYMLKAGEIVPDKDLTYENLVTNYSSNDKLKAIIEQYPGLDKYIEALKRSNALANDLSVNERLLDTKRKYPTYALKELFKGVSKIAESKTINTIKDDVAEIIAKGFTNYISVTGKDITIDSVVNKRCFAFIEEDNVNTVKPYVDLFLAEVAKIVNLRDILKESSLMLLLGAVNKSIRESHEISPEIFQTLYDYSPYLQDKGKLTVENTVEGKLGNFESESTNFIGILGTKVFGGIKSRDIERLATEKTKYSLISSIENSSVFKEANKTIGIFSKYISDVEGSRSVKEVATATLNMLKNVKSQAKETASKIYKESANKIDEINSKLKDITKEKIPEAKAIVTNSLNNYIADIDTLIKSTTKSKDEELEKLNEVKRTIENTVNDSKSIEKINTEIYKLKQTKELEIDSLNKFKNILIRRRDEIINMKVDTIDILEFLRNIKNTMVKLKDEVKSTLDEVEARSNEIESKKLESINSF